jgi:CubicO group peptidase (beta-lactamase class C family)
MMDRFPASPEAQVTLANWRNPPFARWAFQHVRDLIPTAEIANDPANVRALPEEPIDEKKLPLEDFLPATDTDGIVILHRGRLVFERYLNGMTAHTPHILMSVTKSMLGLLAGILAGRGLLDVERPVTDILPELEKTGYKGASVRHLLDMRSGIAFDEDYLATSGPIVEYRKSTGWNPLQPGEAASDLRSFYQQLQGTESPHGGIFRYISPNTDLLGWVIERATGRRYADLMSELLWKPAGTERATSPSIGSARRASRAACASRRATSPASASSWSRTGGAARNRSFPRTGSTILRGTATPPPGRPARSPNTSAARRCTTAPSGTCCAARIPFSSAGASMASISSSIAPRAWSSPRLRPRRSRWMSSA